MTDGSTLAELHEQAQRHLLLRITGTDVADKAERFAHAYNMLHEARPPQPRAGTYNF